MLVDAAADVVDAIDEEDEGADVVVAAAAVVEDTSVEVAAGFTAVVGGEGPAGGVAAAPKYETGSVYPYVAPSYTCDTEHVACASAPIAQLYTTAPACPISVAMTLVASAAIVTARTLHCVSCEYIG